MSKPFLSSVNTNNFSDSNLNGLNYKEIIYNNLKGISEVPIMNLWNTPSGRTDITYMLLTSSGNVTKAQTREIF
jgi:hypothetical protein